MAMKKCKECGADVSSSAKRCPSCGKKLKHTGRIILGILVVIIGIGMFGSGLSGNNNTKPTSSNAQQQEEVMVVDYKTLHADYMANPISADEKYRGKTLQLTGQVGTIDREIDQRTYVTFDIDEYFNNVRITFKKDQESKVAQLSKGQTITIKGKCTGTLLSTVVALDDCEIIE